MIKIESETKYPWQKLVCLISNKDKKVKNTFFKKIRKKLPSYMIPKDLIMIKKFKYNKNGKLDRKVLYK